MAGGSQVSKTPWVAVGVDELRRGWGWLLALGAILILIGIGAIGAVGLTTLASVVFFGWLLVASGALVILHAFWKRGWGGMFLNVLSGALHLVVGFLIVTNPVLGAEAFTLLLAGFFLAVGVVRLGGALALRIEGWRYAAVSGALSMLLGLLIWAGWPGSAIWVIGLFVAIELISYGVSLVMLALALRQSRESQVDEAAASAG
jgi:uncharacterized membrane protein HdeD (DUF308 family)